MNFEMNLVFSVLVVLTGSSQTRGQSSALPPVFTLAALSSRAGSSASPDLTEDPGNEVPAGREETSTPTAAITKTEVTVHSETTTHAAYTPHLLSTSSAVASSQHTNVPVVMTANSGSFSPSDTTLASHPHSSATDDLSSTPPAQSTTPLQHLSTAEGRAPLTRDPLSTVSSQPAHTVQDTNSPALTFTIQPQSESLTTVTAQPITTGRLLTSVSGWGPSGTTHQQDPSELNVGDEDLKGPRNRSSSPLDPLLAGLLSVFIVTTAIVFIILFLKFRQRTNHPEFHRLQDLPMDDLMEDTPLSRYTH